MPSFRPVPAEFLAGPFTRLQGLNAGLTDRMLAGRRFRRLFPGVYVHSDHPLKRQDWIRGAALWLPSDAQVSHLTRLHLLDLDVGPRFPLHFTLAREIHRVAEKVFLHRTLEMPPTDEHGVIVEAAYLGYASTARTIDAIKAGDWLLHRGHLDLARLVELARTQDWRPGSAEVLAIVDELDGRSASMPESEVRSILVRAGLPRPECNADVHHRGRLLGRVDLLYRQWRLIVEYEGRQHLLDLDQWNRDIVRYEGLRDAAWSYLQVTREMADQPRALAMHVHRKLVGQGYGGPAPVFGGRWRGLFERPRAAARLAGR